MSHLKRINTVDVWRWPTELAPAAYSKRTKPWTSDEIRTLRTLTQSGLTLAQIARELKRSQAAIRYKARMYGVALA